MDENTKNATAEAQENTSAEGQHKTREELTQELKARAEEAQKKAAESMQAQMDGRGRLTLSVPIRAGGEDVTELVYDFNQLTGMEYIEAMDTDANAQQVFKITYRQALALFAKAAAKETPKVDMRDILERISGADAEVGTQLAMLFFNVSTRAGRLRISKK